jgi:hypothetical protein
VQPLGQFLSLAAHLLGGLLWDGNPDLLAGNLCQVVLARRPTAEQFKHPLCTERAVFFALLEVDGRNYAGRLDLL